MKFEELYLEGFGVFSDFRLSGLSGGLNILLGPNEAGKSTLRAFIGAVLYGFPRNKNQYYPPLYGGRHGGRVTLEERSSVYTIERFVKDRSATCHNAEGHKLSEDEYRSLLGYLDTKVFNSIFSFGLSELTAFNSADSEEIRDRIFSAGIMGAGRSARFVSDTLVARNDSLLRPRLKTSAEINDLVRAFESNQSKLTRAREQSSRYALLKRDISQVIENKTLLETRLQTKKQESARLGLLLEIWEPYRELADAEKEIELLGVVPELSIEITNKLVAMEEQFRVAENRLAELERRLDRSRAKEMALNNTLTTPLGESINRVEEFLSELKLQEHRNSELRSARIELSSLETTIFSEIRSLGLDWTESNLSGSDTSPKARDKIRTFKASFSKMEDERLRQDEAESRLLEDIAQAKYAVDSTVGQTVEAENGRLKTLFYFLLGVSFLVGLVGVVAYIVNFSQLILPLAFFLFTLTLSLSLGVLLYARLENKRERESRLLVNKQLMGKLEHLESEHNNLSERKKCHNQDAVSLMIAWKEFLQVHGIPDSLSPDAVLELFIKVEGLKSDLDRLNELRMKAGLLESVSHQWDDSARQLLAEVRYPVGEEQAVVEVFVSLRESVLECRKAKLAVGELRQEIRDLLDEIERTRLQKSEAESLLNSLYKDVGVNTAEEYQNLVVRSKRVSELKRISEDRRRAIERRLGVDEQALELWQDLRSGAVQSWEAQLRECRRGVSELEQQIEGVERGLFESEHELKEIEQSSDAAAYELEASQLAEDFLRAAYEWQKNSIAKSLVDYTLQRFVRTRQPEVLQHASQAFAKVTSGAYSGIRAGIDGVSLQVVDGRNATLDPQVLSRGTAEQLYVCVRLAFAAEFRARTVAMPILMDDILVNFDPLRSRALVEELADFSRKHQVLFFTCHPTTAELIAEVAPGAKVIELQQ